MVKKRKIVDSFTKIINIKKYKRSEKYHRLQKHWWTRENKRQANVWKEFALAGKLID